MTWTFNNSTKRPGLTEEQVRKWKTVLSMVRVGVELEFDAPRSSSGSDLEDSKPVCNGTSALCPCTNDTGCSTKCVKEGLCKEDVWYEKCATYQMGRCSKIVVLDKLDLSTIAQFDSTCDSCDDYEFKCLGYQNCVLFENACPTCEKAEHNCSECELSKIPDREPDHPRLSCETIRRRIAEKLEPTGSILQHGKYGILHIDNDGSLTNKGVEVVTTSRVFDWATYVKMFSKVQEVIEPFGLEITERCSTHFHVLLSHVEGLKCTRRPDNVRPGMSHYVPDPSKSFDITDVDEPMPEIILANLHQLIRKYQAALVWIMSSGTKTEELTRWDNFRRPITKYSASKKPMIDVIADMGGTYNHENKNERYHIIHYQPIRFDSNGDITRFHFEFRCGDGSMSPTVTAAWVALVTSMVSKAVELSRFGVLERGSAPTRNSDDDLLYKILNGPRDSYGSDVKRVSKTILSSSDISTLKKQSNELIDLVSSELHKVPEAEAVLRELANKPVSLRRCDGHKWSKIEADLSQVAHSARVEVDTKLLRLITIGSIKATNYNEWVSKTAATLETDKAEVVDTLENLVRVNKIRWSEKKGMVELQ